MIKNNGKDFLAQFDKRVEKIGKDGYFGLIKQTTSPINSNNNIYQFKYLFDKEYNNNLLLKYSKNNRLFNQKYNNFNPNLIDKFHSPFSSLFQLYKIQNYKNFAHNNYRVAHSPLDMKFMDDSKNRKSNSVNGKNPLIYSCQINPGKYNIFKIENNLFSNNKYEIGDNRQNIIDHGYKPYTIKDYKKINNEIDMGKLGANLGTKEWNEKRERMKKMSEYGKQIIFKGKEQNIKNNEIVDEKKCPQCEFENRKWIGINKYPKGIYYNNRYALYENNNANYNDKLNNNCEDNISNKSETIQSKDLIIKQQVNVNYRRKLKKYKHILF